MKFQERYVYHIKDEYFDKANDGKLMRNKENGTYRPTFLCLSDERTGLLWVVPMSTKSEKYQALYDKQVERYGKCLTIVMGKYDGREAAFLLQNMFPITEYYLDHIHTRNGNPVPVTYSIAQTVKANMQQLRQLVSRGKQVVFPDIKRLEKLMLAELQKDHTVTDPSTKSMKERFAEAEARLDQTQTTKQPTQPKEKER